MKFLFLNIIILLWTLAPYAKSNQNEWIIVWGDWRLYNSFLKSYSKPISLTPPGAINNFNSIIYKNKVKKTFKLKLKFKIDKLINRKKSGICGIVFELKNGDNFYTVYIKINNKNYYLILARAYGTHKRGQITKDYKFSQIKEKRILRFNPDKWNILEIFRNKNQIKVKLNNELFFNIKNIKTITDKGRISLITDNIICSFKSLDIYNHKKIELNFNIKEMKLKQLQIKTRVDKFQNPAFGP